MANSQKQALKASKDLKASLADKDQEVILVIKALEVILELPAHKALRDHLVNADLRATKAIQALLGKTELYHLIN